MNNPLLIFLKEKGLLNRGSLYTHFLSKISKVDYSSKAKVSNVRGVGTFFFDTCSNLGRILSYNFKYLYAHLPKNLYRKLYTL